MSEIFLIHSDQKEKPIFLSKRLFYVFASSWKNSEQKILSITNKIFLPTIFFFPNSIMVQILM